jgi:hypothetical protein
LHHAQGVFIANQLSTMMDGQGGMGGMGMKRTVLWKFSIVHHRVHRCLLTLSLCCCCCHLRHAQGVFIANQLSTMMDGQGGMGGMGMKRTVLWRFKFVHRIC